MSQKQVARQKKARSSHRPPPWRTDAEAARQAARREGKPFVLILNADSGAL
jgi:hypothetical protein